MIRLLKTIGRYNDEITLVFIGVFLYLAANATQAGWLYFIVSLLITLLSAAFVLPRFNVRHVQVWREVPPFVFEGDMVDITFHVRNTGRKEKFILFLVVRENPAFFSDEGEKYVHIHSLKPGETRKFTVHYTCNKRGKAGLLPYMLGSSFPLSFFPAYARFTQPDVLYIYPAGPEPSRLMEKSGSSVQYGRQKALSLAGRSFDFLGIREYRPTDGTRFIHWPSTARLNRLMVKEFSELGHRTCSIVIETGTQWGRGRESTLEYGIKLAAGIVNYCSRREIVMYLAAAEGDTILEISNPARLQALEFLACLEANGRLSPAHILDDRALHASGSHLFIIQGSLSPGLEDAIRQIPRGTNATIFLVMGCTFTAAEALPAPSGEEYEGARRALQALGAEVIMVRQGDDLAALLEESSVMHGNH